MQKIIVIGAVGSGKTTLINALHNNKEASRKTQSLEFNSRTIDTPGEYMENPRYYRALLATAVDVTYVLFMQDATRKNSIFPPGLGQTFPGYSLGVITKIDHPGADVDLARKLLGQVALKGNIFLLSPVTGEGMDELKHNICWQDNS